MSEPQHVETRRQYSPGRLSHLEPAVGLFADWLARHAVERPAAAGR